MLNKKPRSQGATIFKLKCSAYSGISILNYMNYDMKIMDFLNL